MDWRHPLSLLLTYQDLNCSSSDGCTQCAMNGRRTLRIDRLLQVFFRHGQTKCLERRRANISACGSWRFYGGVIVTFVLLIYTVWSKRFRTDFFCKKQNRWHMKTHSFFLIQNKLHWNIYRLLRGRTVSEKLPKIPHFGSSLIHQLRLLGSHQHPQSGVLLNWTVSIPLCVRKQCINKTVFTQQYNNSSRLLLQLFR